MVDQNQAKDRSSKTLGHSCLGGSRVHCGFPSFFSAEQSFFKGNHTLHPKYITELPQWISAAVTRLACAPMSWNPTQALGPLGDGSPADQ